MLRVVAVTTEPQASFELACVADIFGILRPGDRPWASLTIATERPGLMATKAGFKILVDHGLGELDDADLVFVTGWPMPQTPSPALTDALLRAHTRGATIAGLCSGSFALAETGLLDGRTATTHWSQVGDLSARYPLVKVTQDVLYIDHGDVATSGGAGAATDLALHLARRLCGPGVAAGIARHMVLPPHRTGGQRQYALDPRPAHDSALFSGLLDWCVDHLGDDLGAKVLAARAGVSERTLSRRFRSHLGVSPATWVLHQRISRAAHLLQTTDMLVAAIASAVGLPELTNFRHQFSVRVGATPGDYRRTFAPGITPGRGEQS